VKEIYKERMDF